MSISQEDVQVLADLLAHYGERSSALAILKALSLPDVQGVGHSSFVEKVRSLLHVESQAE